MEALEKSLCSMLPCGAKAGVERMRGSGRGCGGRLLAWRGSPPRAARDDFLPKAGALDLILAKRAQR